MELNDMIFENMFRWCFRHPRVKSDRFFWLTPGDFGRSYFLWLENGAIGELKIVMVTRFVTLN